MLCGFIGAEGELPLAQAEMLYRSILEASADCIIVLSLDARIELMNGPGLRAMDLESTASARPLEWADLWTRKARPRAWSAIEDARDGKVARFVAKRPGARGTAKWWDVVITPIQDEKGPPARLLCICRDITGAKTVADRLRWTSKHDSLTRLANRAAFQEHLEAAALRSMASGEGFGLLLLDLDYFKHVNDTLGHAAGDELLKVVAERLQSSTRSSDFAARLGGDEFAVVIDGVGTDDELIAIGNRIVKQLNAAIQIGGRMVRAGVSIGGARFPGHGSAAHELFNNADTALYALKNSGRGGTKLFESQMRAQAQQVASQLSLARVALDENSVQPHYQAKVDLQTGKITGYEALLRWLHPQRGLQLPSTVQEAFKDFELASKIGELVQNRVISDIRSWLDQGLDFGRVSINAAPAEFLRDDYAEKLLSALEQGRVDPRFVEVEVTEHVFLDRGSEYVSRALNLLNQEGVQIALDDFGTGYSSLSHLRDFPVQVVKIDHSFVERMVEDDEISAIVTAVIRLAQSLSLSVVAEGVETDQQRRILVDKGCPLGQGFLYGRPASFAAASAGMRAEVTV